MLKKKISKIVAVIGIVSVLFLSLVFPSSAFSGASFNGDPFSLYSLFPLNSFIVNTKAFGFDPEEEGGTTYFYEDYTYSVDIPEFVPTDVSLRNKLEWYKSHPISSADYDIFYSSSDTVSSTFRSSISAKTFQTKYDIASTLTYYNKWIPQNNMVVDDPLLPLITTFNSSKYTEAAVMGYRFPAGKDDSFVLEFNDYLVLTSADKRPYIQFDINNFPLSANSYKCYVTYDYDVVTVVEEDGEAVLKYTHKTQTATPDSWNKYQFVYVLPYASTTTVVTNVKVTVNIRDLNQTHTYVPSDFQYIQPVARDGHVDALEHLDNFNTIIKYKSITDVTEWIGETVSDFFDIELFPGLRLSYVLGIIIAVSLSIWLLKLLAGG